MADFSASTAPITFHDFLEKMRHPNATELVRAIKSFLGSFPTSPADLNGESVQAFMESAEAQFRANPLWRGSSEDELQAACEGLEKYLMTKLYSHTFAVTQEDIEADEHLAARIRALQVLTPDNLDIPLHFRNEQSWLLAQKELQKINQYKAPRDKLVCVLNCCRVIANLLNVCSAGGAPPGADDFLPVLIYVVLQGDVPHLCSNLEYIMRFRLASRLRSEALYYYTNIVSAVSFVRTMTADQLSGMDPDKFQAAMDAAGVMPYTPPLPEIYHPDVAATPLPPTATLTTAATTQAASSGTLTTPVPALSPAEALPTPHAVPTPSLNLLPALNEGRAGSGSMRGDQMVFKQPSQSVLFRALGQTTSAGAATRDDTRSRAAPVAIAAATTAAESEPSTSTTAWATPEALEKLGMRKLVQADQQGQLQIRHRYIYAQPGDLRVSDVGILLRDYKELVLSYEALCNGLEAVRGGYPAVPAAAAAADASPRSTEGSDGPSLGLGLSDSMLAFPPALLEGEVPLPDTHEPSASEAETPVGAPACSPPERVPEACAPHAALTPRSLEDGLEGDRGATSRTLTGDTTPSESAYQTPSRPGDQTPSGSGYQTPTEFPYASGDDQAGGAAPPSVDPA